MNNSFNVHMRIQSLLSADTDDFAKLAETVGLDIRRDFSGADLRGVNLVNAELKDADFSFADLSNANLENADLENANLRSVNFTKANLTGCNFSNADLRDTILDEAILNNAIFTNALKENSGLDTRQEKSDKFEERTRYSEAVFPPGNKITSKVGTQKIYHAIKSRHPELEDVQVAQIIEVVLDQVAKRIGSGDALAFFHLGDDDQAELITYSLEAHARRKG